MNPRKYSYLSIKKRSPLTRSWKRYQIPYTVLSQPRLNVQNQKRALFKRQTIRKRSISRTFSAHTAPNEKINLGGRLYETKHDALCLIRNLQCSWHIQWSIQTLSNAAGIRLGFGSNLTRTAGDTCRHVSMCPPRAHSRCLIIRGCWHTYYNKKMLTACVF